MFGHDGEAVQCVTALVAVMEEGFGEKAGVRCACEESAALRSHGCDGIGVARECHEWFRRAYLRGFCQG